MSDVSILALNEDQASHSARLRHVAIIMDGNGRWAKERGLPRIEGHRRGVEAVRKITRFAGEYKLAYLTLYCFSSENWQRPPSEINELFGLLRLFIRRNLEELNADNVCIKVIGERNGVPQDIYQLITKAVDVTRNNTGLTLVIAFNYGARDEIATAARNIAQAVICGQLAVEDITPETVERHLSTNDIPDPDLIIRTSGEQRLSNFLLWQAAYSEFVFTDCKWPDFDEEAFSSALDDYYSRERRFGAVSAIKKHG